MILYVFVVGCALLLVVCCCCDVLFDVVGC